MHSSYTTSQQQHCDAPVRTAVAPARRRRVWHRSVCRASASEAERFAAAKLLYTEHDYERQRQAEGRRAWAEQASEAWHGQKQALSPHWQPELSPPPLLAQVSARIAW